MYRPHLDFVLSVHEQLPSDGDLAWSPYSVASALGVAAAGARTRTYDEIVRVLTPGGELDRLAGILSESARPTDAEAAVANTLWMRIGLQLRDTFQQAVVRWPGGAVRAADFQADPEGSREEINDDVERETHGLITDLLPPGTIQPETAAVIVNALYLKVAWQLPFVPAETAPAAFHAPSGTRDVATMHQQERFDYAEAGGWRMVTLPTASEAVVDVLLPDSAGARLSVATVTGLQQASSRTRVDLALPRFRIEATAVLNDVLGQLGVTAAFDPGAADFSGIADEPMFIDSAVHKAVVRVDERGFEGAAATAVAMRLTSMDMSQPVPFHVDRPFVVLVRHARTGAVYFLARVVEP